MLAGGGGGLRVKVLPGGAEALGYNGGGTACGGDIGDVGDTTGDVSTGEVGMTGALGTGAGGGGLWAG